MDHRLRKLLSVKKLRIDLSQPDIKIRLGGDQPTATIDDPTTLERRLATINVAAQIADELRRTPSFKLTDARRLNRTTGWNFAGSLFDGWRTYEEYRLTEDDLREAMRIARATLKRQKLADLPFVSVSIVPD